MSYQRILKSIEKNLTNDITNDIKLTMKGSNGLLINCNVHE